MNRKNRLFIFPVILILASLACNAPFAQGTPQAVATLDQLYTQAALTAEAISTPIQFTPSPFVSPTSPFPTYLVTITPSQTPVPVALCDAAAFVKDVTVPDGAIIGPGTSFTKTWRIQNVGTCSWTPSYTLVFSGGDNLNAPTSVSMPGNINPGQLVDLSVTLTAPTMNGHYQGYWKLRNSAGVLFGIGEYGQGAFWVDINVAGPSYTAYDFAANYCDANWNNLVNDLPCPGNDGDTAGYEIKLDHPTMESGKTEDQPGLLTVPRNATNGVILGTYPAFNVQYGDHFQSNINCQYLSYNCNVIFKLNYQIGSSGIKTLGQWNEVYEGKYYPVDIDLSAFAGQNVKFILVVTANGAFNQDNALWLAPRIVRLGTPPPTSTFTVTPSPTATSTPTFTPTASSTPTETPTP